MGKDPPKQAMRLYVGGSEFTCLQFGSESHQFANHLNLSLIPSLVNNLSHLHKSVKKSFFDHFYAKTSNKSNLNLIYGEKVNFQKT